MTISRKSNRSIRERLRAEIPNGELDALVRLPVGAAMLCAGDGVRGARRECTDGIRQ
jgi:hypothetical protein